MKKKILTGLLLAVMSVSMSANVYAEEYTGGEGWNVTFTSTEKMESNFKSGDMDDVVMGLQPGDSVEFSVFLENQHKESTNWYMTNEVLSSLEDSSKVASGGAYAYRLTYTDIDGEVTTLFDSDTVGGDEISPAGEGLHEATDALEEYFYLDTLSNGQSGEVKLMVALDGETQGNDYQDTLADLQMNFAVELGAAATSQSPDSSGSGHWVKTGDDTNMLPWIIAMAASGLAILFFAIYCRKKNKNNQEGSGTA